jgi:response regulator RpfG family c-di-GMP phosphodiesterase
MKKRSTVLFVDDEKSVLHALKRSLHAQASAWELHFAEGVAEALLAVRSASIDVVVTDVDMPGRDGFELLRCLRSEPSTAGIPLIVLTGAADRSLKRRALELGAVDLLNKPVVTEDLVARLRSALRLKHYEDELRHQNLVLDQLVAERTTALEWSRLEVIWRLAKVGEYRDEQTGNHVVRVGSYSRLLAGHLGLPREFCDTLFLTSALHDIGKIGVSDAVLLKPGPLDPDERLAMQCHCEIGHNILQQEAPGTMASLQLRGVDLQVDPTSLSNPVLRQAAVIARSHHEKWDGSGYPHGLSGEGIPIEARIVAVADVYDALSHARPYKPALPEAQVLSIMREQASGHFDPEVFEAFLGNIAELRGVEAWLEQQGRAAA